MKAPFCNRIRIELNTFVWIILSNSRVEQTQTHQNQTKPN